ncbi:MAG: formate dehydrogenase accessory sulfurtransferase FdhD [Thermoleophilia bacterium]|nr:formate dehydrogenase accessory sulfurtransferase FdhD [Thermoleophilia bacterium]
MELSTPSDRSIQMQRVTERGAADAKDLLVAEEPLGVLLSWPGRGEPYELVVTMRTPGDDEALATGYLLSEGILRDRVSVVDLKTLPGAEGEATQIVVCLSAPPESLDRQRRTGYASSSCGLCGKASVSAVIAADRPEMAMVDGVWSSSLIRSLPQRMRDEQEVFERTGGLHAAALFDATGELRLLAEDVGRHNAVDKAIGEVQLRAEAIAPEDILVVSGRAGFEIVQKAVMAGIAGMAAVGAPSSLAVELAERSGMTLIGFLRERRFNVYTGARRLRLDGLESP